MTAQRIGPKGLALVKAFEAFVPYPYDDLLPPAKGVYREWRGGPVAGTLTIGYGHTDAARHPLKVRPGLRLSEREATEVLDADMDGCEADVRRLVQVPLTQGQFDTLCSFTFNCGPGALRNIAGRLNRGDYAAARAALGLYVKAKGRRLPGLVRRRAAEQALWDDPDAPAPGGEGAASDGKDTAIPPSAALNQTSTNARWLGPLAAVLALTLAAFTGAVAVAWRQASNLVRHLF